jgi:transposase
VAATTGAMIAQVTVPAIPAGYQQLLDLADQHHRQRVWAIESTGGDGAGLTRFLTAHHQQVVELDRPKRATRRHGAKSDSEDVAGEDVRRGHQDGLTRSPTDHWVSCLGSVGHAGWPRRARTEQAP